MSTEITPKPALSNLPWASLVVAGLAFLLAFVIPNISYALVLPSLVLTPVAWLGAIVLAIVSLAQRRAPRWPAIAALVVVGVTILFGLAAAALVILL